MISASRPHLVPPEDGRETGPEAGPAPGKPGRGAQEPADGCDRAADDVDLVARIAARDTAALDALYARYGRPAFSLACRICGDRGLAEDVVQEVFLALWRDHGRFDGRRGTVASWLMTVVHHKSVDAVRREVTRRRHHPLAAHLEETVGSGGAPAQAADRLALGSVIAEHVRAALGRLPREQRETLGLAYYGGYTQREVAVLTGVPVGTVKSRMFAGVARLRVLLGPVLGASPFDVLGDRA